MSFAFIMRSWEESASESIFSVQMTAVQSAEPSSSSHSSKHRLPRNKKPCGRCSDRQKKCDISHPYSPACCRACAKAKLPSCPPHKSRRSGSMKTSSSRIHASEQPQVTGSGPVTSQGTVAGAHLKSDHIEYKTTADVETRIPAQSHEPTSLDLDYANLLASFQAVFTTNDPVFGSFEQTASDRGSDSVSSLLPYNSQFPQTEDGPSNTKFELLTSFDPTLLSFFNVSMNSEFGEYFRA